MRSPFVKFTSKFLCFLSVSFLFASASAQEINTSTNQSTIQPVNQSKDQAIIQWMNEQLVDPVMDARQDFEQGQPHFKGLKYAYGVQVPGVIADTNILPVDIINLDIPSAVLDDRPKVRIRALRYVQRYNMMMQRILKEETTQGTLAIRN
ncbi:MAG: hypothetical protein P1U57_11515 [Oleibacter sp.]|nr:hypothetical protein [Thalassolituus sp.]